MRPPDLIPSVVKGDWDIRNAIRICELQYANVLDARKDFDDLPPFAPKGLVEKKLSEIERQEKLLEKDRERVSEELAKLLSSCNQGSKKE